VNVIGARWIGKRGGGAEQLPDARFAIFDQDLPDGRFMTVSRSLQELSEHDVRIVPSEE
jgi:hypothetical protein